MTTLTQQRGGKGSNTVDVYTKVKPTITESEVLHWLLVEALKDAFKVQGE